MMKYVTCRVTDPMDHDTESLLVHAKPTIVVIEDTTAR